MAQQLKYVGENTLKALWQKINGRFLSKSDANSTYLKKTDAANTYATTNSQVQADWNIIDVDNKGFIKNKPTFPDLTGVAYQSWVNSQITASENEIKDTVSTDYNTLKKIEDKIIVANDDINDIIADLAEVTTQVNNEKKIKFYHLESLNFLDDENNQIIIDNATDSFTYNQLLLIINEAHNNNLIILEDMNYLWNEINFDSQSDTLFLTAYAFIENNIIQYLISMNINAIEEKINIQLINLYQLNLLNISLTTQNFYNKYQIDNQLALIQNQINDILELVGE